MPLANDPRDNYGSKAINDSGITRVTLVCDSPVP